MRNMPERIWAWNFIPSKQDDVIKGGWGDEPDRKSTEYVRSDCPPRWQPIETAPKDGEIIVAASGIPEYNGYSFIQWDDECGWCGYTANDERRLVKFPPSFWMPLPEPPVQS